MSHPTLYHSGKKDKMYSWRVWTEEDMICTEFGTLDGEKQIAKKKALGKNIGKKNETSPEEQAELEAKSMWQNKLDRKYRLTEEEASKPLPLPMLAYEFSKKADKVTYPCDLQPKLDGVRCLARWENGKVELLSRSGKPYTAPTHIIEELECILPTNTILDGELYAHGESLQTINSWVKKKRDETTRILFWAYDVIDETQPKEPWACRWHLLVGLFNRPAWKTARYVVQTPCYEAQDEEEIHGSHDEFLEQGFEGAIIRLPDGVYRFGYRSNSLLKVKAFDDDEFKVVGYYGGKTEKSKDCVTFECAVGDDKFGVVPKGTLGHKRQLYKDAESYIGKWLKVQYFGFSDNGTPLLPIGLCFRLEEDMDLKS